MLSADLSRADEDRLWRFRNLGKAFYENPTTQKQAVDEFRKARDLAPNSTREIMNYGLALLRAGDVAGGIAQLEKAQKLDPKIPHTWFNLGIAFKKQAEFDRALPQFQQMARLVPNEPMVHYQLGALHKLGNNLAAATKEFERARDLNPRLAAPHFQLYGIYRQANRPEDAAAELAKFQELKKQQEGAAVPEDMEWSFYSEIYDAPPAPPSAPPLHRGLSRGEAGSGLRRRSLGHPGARPRWRPSQPDRVGNGRATLFRNGNKAATDSGLEDLRDVVSIARRRFRQRWPAGSVRDHHQRRAALPQRERQFRNGTANWRAARSARPSGWTTITTTIRTCCCSATIPGCCAITARPGSATNPSASPSLRDRRLDAVRFDLEPDTPGFDLVVSYADRPGVLYRDALGGTYTAQDIAELPAGAAGLAAGDANHDGRTDLAARLPDGKPLLLANRDGKFQRRRRVRRAASFPSSARWISMARARATAPPSTTDGVLSLGRNVTPAYGNWIEIALTGVKNAKLAVGAQIEVKAGTDYQKVTYEGVPLVVRLGARTQVDTVRITWPNGLIQNETKQPVNRLTTIKEAPRLSGSCPMIFTWNGERFQFITDVLGVAPLGASSGDGQYFPVDHDEYVSIPGEALKARDGEYEIRVTEELREVSYLDQIQLIALDHPADVEIVTNEKFKSPPFPGVPAVRRAAARLSRRGARPAGRRRARRARAARSRLPRSLPPRPDRRRRDASPRSGFRQRRARQSRGADPERLGGLGRRQHLPRRHAGAPAT